MSYATPRAAARAAIADLPIFALARRADVADPDRAGDDRAEWSPGALLLDGVRGAFLDALDEHADELDDATDAWKLRDLLDDAAVQAADDAPSIYTHRMWLEFADLAAWTVDTSDFGPVEDMSKGASIALYEVARILWADLEELYVQTYDDAAEDEDDDDDEEE